MNSASELPFFHRRASRLLPTEAAEGPWKAGTLHGRVIVGLLAAEIERLHGDPAYLPARLAIDMYRSPGRVPLEVQTRLVRNGRRIRVIDAELIADGQSVARASCQMLLRAHNPLEGEAWHGESWDAPSPEMLAPLPPGVANMNGLWDMRMISGRIGEVGQRRLWMRENRALIEGEALTPFARIASGADYISPLANSGDTPVYSFVNSDLTLYLHRLPEGEWIGYETIGHEASDGIGVAHCNLYDERGRVGWGSACALAQAYRDSGAQ